MQRQKKTARELRNLLRDAVPAFTRKTQIIIGLGHDGEWFATVLANSPEGSDRLQVVVNAAVVKLRVEYELV
jgi:hypothetical protein